MPNLGNDQRKLTIARNGSPGKGRIGSFKGRSQTRTGCNHFVKRDSKTGQFMDVKSDGKPFKGLTKEK